MLRPNKRTNADLNACDIATARMLDETERPFLAAAPLPATHKILLFGMPLSVELLLVRLIVLIPHTCIPYHAHPVSLTRMQMLHIIVGIGIMLGHTGLLWLFPTHTLSLLPEDTWSSDQIFLVFKEFGPSWFFRSSPWGAQMVA